MFCQWSGFSSEELVERRRFQDLLTVGGRIFHQTHWAPLLRMQGSISEVKLELSRRDGTTIPVVVNAIRHEQAGQMVHDIAAFVARDRDAYERELITSRRRLEELVAEANRLHAEARDRALFAEQMVGIVSHDLRNPLSGIAMATAVLARGDLTDSQQRTLSRISRSTERANRLIADLLDFTQARLGGGLKVTIQSIDLHQLFGDAVEELALTYPGRGLKHLRVGDGGLCEADPDRLVQLVGNLVSNAMTYGTPDRPVIATSSVDDTTVSVSVHNHGPAIPQDVQDRMFEPMTRGSESANAARSVGLGLFIVRQIAQAHGGTAHVRSTVEEGTTLCVMFPRRRPR
jgi:sigma-B regulation protein RsbU (phosphoserine phosphatase)